MKKLIVLGIAYMSCTLAFAADLAAKEDMTPPAPEDALTVDQIPPIRSMAPKTSTPPTTQPAALPSSTVPTPIQPVQNAAPNPPPANIQQ